MVLNFNKSTLSIPDSIFDVGTLVCLLSRCVSLPLSLPFIPFFKYLLSCYLAHSSILQTRTACRHPSSAAQKVCYARAWKWRIEEKDSGKRERVEVTIAVTSSNINKGDSLSLKVGRSFILFYFKALFPCTKVYVLSSSYNFYSCLLDFIIFLSLKLLCFFYPFFLFLLIYFEFDFFPAVVTWRTYSSIGE